MRGNNTILFEQCKDNNLEYFQKRFRKWLRLNPILITKDLDKVLLPLLTFVQIDSTKRTLLHWASYLGHLELVKFFFIFKIPNRNSIDQQGYRAVNLAVIKGQQIKNQIIKHRFNEDNYDNEAKKNQFELVQYLMENNCNQGIDDKKGTILHWACYYNNEKLIEYLLIRKFELIWVKNEEKELALDWLFLENKNANQKLNNKFTFQLICRYFKQNVYNETAQPLSLSLKIEEEPDINKKYLNCLGKKATFFFKDQKSRNYQIDQFDQLIDQRVHQIQNEENRNSNLISPLENRNERQKKRQELYFIRRKSTSLKDELEQAFLIYASALGDEDNAIYFLKQHANPFLQNTRGYNAILMATKNKQTQILEIFLKTNYKYDDKNFLDKVNKYELINLLSFENPSSPLHFAVENENLDCINLLLESGASIETINFRTLKPFELTNNEKILEFYTQIKPIDPFNFVDQGFKYCLVTKGMKSIKDDIILMQLQNIKEKYEDMNLPFEFISFKGINFLKYNNYKLDDDTKIQMPKSPFHFFVIKPSLQLLLYMAEHLKMKCFNLKHKVIMNYSLEHQKQFEKLKDIQIQQIIYYLLNEEFDVSMFLKEGLLLEHYPLHDLQLRSKIQEFWDQEQANCLIDPLRIDTVQTALRPLHAISSYYGPKIGWYFSFLVQFTSWLLIPTIPGLALGIYMLITLNMKTFLIPIYSIFVAIWSTIFIEKWKRRQSELSFCWDMHEYQDQEPQRFEYQGQFCVDQVTGQLLTFDKFTTFKRKLIIDLPIILLGIGLMFGLFYGFLQLQLKAGDNMVLKIIAGVGNGSCITILGFVYRMICFKIIEWENHKLQSELEYSYIMKIFIFEFLNSYLMLFYLGVYIGDQTQLIIQVGSIVISRGLVHNIVSNGIPFILYQIKNKIFTKYMNHFKQFNFSFLNNHQQYYFIEQENLFNKLQFKLLFHFQQQLEHNLILMPQKDLIDEYTNLCIQFGYITMFAPAFPAAPLFVCLNNYLNLRFTLYNYQNIMKRNYSEGQGNLGIWLNILSLMNYAATMMNCVLIWSSSSEQLNILIGEGSKLRNIQVLFGVEHFIIMLKYLLEIIIEDEPYWVQREIRRQKYHETIQQDDIIDQKKNKTESTLKLQSCQDLEIPTNKVEGQQQNSSKKEDIDLYEPLRKKKGFINPSIGDSIGKIQFMNF